MDTALIADARAEGKSCNGGVAGDFIATATPTSDKVTTAEDSKPSASATMVSPTVAFGVPPKCRDSTLPSITATLKSNQDEDFVPQDTAEPQVGAVSKFDARAQEDESDAWSGTILPTLASSLVEEKQQVSQPSDLQSAVLSMTPTMAEQALNTELSTAVTQSESEVNGTSSSPNLHPLPKDDGKESMREEEILQPPANLVVTFTPHQDHDQLQSKTGVQGQITKHAKALSTRQFQQPEQQLPRQQLLDPRVNDEVGVLPLVQHHAAMENILDENLEEWDSDSESEASDWSPLMPDQFNTDPKISDSESGGIDQDSYDFATNKFLAFLASCQLHCFVNASGVMVVGLTRAGKSSAIMVQRGSTLKKEGREFVPRYSDGDPLVSGSGMSKTINVGAYDDHQGQFKWFDTAGLDENRGEAYKCWTRFSLLTARSLLRDLRATLVVINFRSTFEGAGNVNMMRDLAELISVSSGGAMSDDYLNNMCFLMTNVDLDLTDMDAIKYVQQLFWIELKQLIAVLKGLTKRVGKEGMLHNARNEATKLNPETLSGGFFDLLPIDYLSRQVNQLFAKASRAQRRINAEGLMKLPDSDEDKKMLLRVTASIRMLQAILQAGPKRLTLGYPDGPRLCKIQRESIDRMVEQCTAIDHDKLIEMTSSGSLRVFGILAHIARNLTTQLEDLHDRGNRLLVSLAEEVDKVAAIESYWHGYKVVRLKQIADELQAHQSEVNRLHQRILELKSSTNLVAPPTYIYTVQKSTTLLNWFGFTRVIQQFTHVGPFVDYQVEGQLDTYTELEKSPEKVTLEFTGEWRSALKACVKFRRYEKDTAETKSQVEVWERRVKVLNEEIANLKGKNQVIQPCQTKDALMAVVLDESKSRARMYCEAWQVLNKKMPTTVFHGEDDMEIKVSSWEVCLGLRGLLSAIQKRGAFDQEMRDSGLKQVTEEFCLAMAKVNDLQSIMKANNAARSLTDEKDNVETGQDNSGPANGFDVYRAGVPNQVTPAGRVVGRESALEGACLAGEGGGSNCACNPTTNTESELLGWLGACKISQKGVQVLEELGATTVDDVAMIVNDPDCEGMLGELPRLDAVKIKKAVSKLV